MLYPPRRAALRALLRAADVDALLVTDLVNVRYLTGFSGSNAALLVHVDGDGASRFCTDGRHRTQSAQQVPDLETVIDRGSALRRNAHYHHHWGREVQGQARLSVTPARLDASHRHCTS